MGLIISALIMSPYAARKYNKADFENIARGFGMEYPQEMNIK